MNAAAHLPPAAGVRLFKKYPRAISAGSDPSRMSTRSTGMPASPMGPRGALTVLPNGGSGGRPEFVWYTTLKCGKRVNVKVLKSGPRRTRIALQAVQAGPEAPAGCVTNIYAGQR